MAVLIGSRSPAICARTGRGRDGLERAWEDQLLGVCGVSQTFFPRILFSFQVLATATAAHCTLHCTLPPPAPQPTHCAPANTSSLSPAKTPPNPSASAAVQQRSES